MKDNLKATGHISWLLTKADGTTQAGETPNVVTNWGKQWMAGIVGSASGFSTGTWFGFGTSIGTGAGVSSGDASLFVEIPFTGYSYSRSTTSKSVSSSTIQYIASVTGLSVGTGLTINEVGLFTTFANSGGSGQTYLAAHQLTGAVVMTSSSDSLQITWNITLN